MEHLLKRCVMSSIIFGFIVVIASQAHGQNFSGLNAETGETAQPEAAAAIQPSTTQEVVQPKPPAVSDPNINAEKTIQVDPLSDENIEEVVAMTTKTGLTKDEVSRYTLGPKDVISVNVMRHPEVSGSYEINAEGKIQYEFVGDVVVENMTKDEVTKVLKERLSEYIVNPDVTVKISGYNSKVVYVVGEVGQPGKIFMQGNTITVRDALLQAGLPLLSGVTKKSSLITPSESGKINKANVDVYALLYQGDLRENKIMNPGDILYIPPTFLTKTMRAISPITQPLSGTASTASQVSGAPGMR